MLLLHTDIVGWLIWQNQGRVYVWAAIQGPPIIYIIFSFIDVGWQTNYISPGAP